MSEVKNNKQFVFNFTDRKVKLNKSDFTSQAEKKIYEFFQQNTQNKDSITQNDFYNRFKLLDFGDDSQKVVTEKEISEFLKQAQAQGTLKIGDTKFKTKMLKDITEEDLINFFNKVVNNNPTEIESKKKALTSGLKDEQGNPVFNDEILGKLQNKNDYIKVSDIVDENGNIKPGFETFDLNDDGKIDEIETKEWKLGFDLDTLQNYQQKFIDAGATNGIITPDSKHAYYKNLEKAHNSELLSKLQGSSIKDPSSNTDLVTNEVKHLFSVDRPEISVNDLVDENGYIKKGLEIFDLNNDGKMDELERNYFTNGGKYINKGSDKITLEDFTRILKNIDEFDKKEDHILSQSDKTTIYRYIQGAYQMMDSLQEFPEDIRNLYEQALCGLSHVEIDKGKDKSGYLVDHTLGINHYDGKIDKYQVASTLIHELTHFICNHLSDGKEYNLMAQEVQTFYMEHKLYEKMKDLPEFRGSKLTSPSEYTYLKGNNPELTELDIAKAVFREHHYDSYSGRYGNKDPNILENSEYRDIGGFFSEPENKAQIYNAAIQKAFSGLSVKDENGKELITDELKNAFSAEKPILSTKDILNAEGNIKPGFEIFDFDGDGSLSGNERGYIGLITYNDIPRLVETLKRFNEDLNNDTGDTISTQVRNDFSRILSRGDLRPYYNFHQVGEVAPQRLNLKNYYI